MGARIHPEIQRLHLAHRVACRSRTIPLMRNESLGSISRSLALQPGRRHPTRRVIARPSIAPEGDGHRCLDRVEHGLAAQPDQRAMDGLPV